MKKNLDNQAVRGIIPAGTAVPISEIGWVLADALMPTAGILRRITESVNKNNPQEAI